MFELKQLNIIKFCLSNGKFRGSKTKYEIANYSPDGVTGKFVISGRYCCVYCCSLSTKFEEVQYNIVMIGSKEEDIFFSFHAITEETTL